MIRIRLASATRSLLPSARPLSTPFTRFDAFTSVRTIASNSLSARRFFTERKVPEQQTQQQESPQQNESEAKEQVLEEEETAGTAEEVLAEEEPALSEEHQKLLEDMKILSAELEAKKAEAKEFKDKLLTSYADMENVRARARKDVDLAGQQAVRKMAGDLLRVADTLSIAAKAGSDALKLLNEEDQEKLQSFEEGIINTEKLLLSAFEAQGITKFESLGEKFNPHVHEGLFEYDDPTQEPGTIGQVMREGYMIKDYVLRAAQVGTIKKR